MGNARGIDRNDNNKIFERGNFYTLQRKRKILFDKLGFVVIFVVYLSITWDILRWKINGTDDIFLGYTPIILLCI